MIQIMLMYSISIYDQYQYGACVFMIIQLLSNNIARYIVLFRKFLGWVFFFLEFKWSFLMSVFPYVDKGW